MLILLALALMTITNTHGHIVMLDVTSDGLTIFAGYVQPMSNNLFATLRVGYTQQDYNPKDHGVILFRAYLQNLILVCQEMDVQMDTHIITHRQLD